MISKVLKITTEGSQCLQLCFYRQKIRKKITFILTRFIDTPMINCQWVSHMRVRYTHFVR